MLLRNCAWVRDRPVWLRIPVFVVPFLLLWLFLDSILGLPDLVSTILIYLAVVPSFGCWGRYIHNQEHPYRVLGLSLSQRGIVEVASGFCLGIAGIAIPLLMERWLGWLMFEQVPAMQLISAFANAITTALAVSFAEELLFRGWLFEELRLNYTGWIAGVVTTSIFSAVHQWGLQTLGLLLVGSILVRAKVLSRGRLGLPIGLHGGWVFAISFVNIAGLLSFTSAVPSWVTGVGENMLAGVVGWGVLIVTWLIIECGLGRRSSFDCLFN